MQKKIMLVDGNSIINRAFYGVPILSNAQGLYTNGVYGFLNILFKLLDEDKPDYIAVAFDLKAPTFRHEVFKEYKGNRKGMPEELKPQIPLLKMYYRRWELLDLKWKDTKRTIFLELLQKQKNKVCNRLLYQEIGICFS